MPGTLFASLLNHAASHLVTLVLLGFLAVGLALFGVIDLPLVPSAADARGTSGAGRPAPETPTVLRSSDASPAAAQPTEPVADEPAPVERPAPGAPRHQPKMIGGSIPVYEESAPEPPAAVPHGDAPGPDGFRPSVEPLVETPPMDRDTLVQQARRAFWNGDFEAAEAAYMILLTAYPGDADGFGELGNLYQAMGRPEQALDAFFEAGMRLKATGETEKLQQIIELLLSEGDDRVKQLAP